MSENLKKTDPLFNLVIIGWLFLPVVILFSTFFLTTVDVVSNFSINQLKMQYIVQNFFNLNYNQNSFSFQSENLSLILVIFGGFFIYCYIFDLISKKGFNIFSNENQKSEYFSSLPFLFITSLLVVYFLSVFSQNFFKDNENEIFFCIIILVILATTFFLWIQFKEYANSYEGMKKIASLRKGNIEKSIVFANGEELYIFAFQNLKLYSTAIFILTFVIFFIWMKYNLDVLTFLVIETSLLYFHIFFSSITLSEKGMFDIKFKPNMQIDDKNDVFIVENSNNGHLVILSNDSKISFIMKDSIFKIIPIKIADELTTNNKKENSENLLIEIRNLTIKSVIDSIIHYFLLFVCFIIFILLTMLFSNFSQFTLFLLTIAIIGLTTIGLKMQQIQGLFNS